MSSGEGRLRSREAAAYAGVTVEHWRKHGPAPDGPWDKRSGYWLRSTVDEWLRERASRRRNRCPPGASPPSGTSG